MPRTPRRLTWSCSSYRRTGWIGRDGPRQYRAHFQALDADGSWTICTIRLWTRHPVRALRSITATPRTADQLLALDDHLFT